MKTFKDYLEAANIDHSAVAIKRFYDSGDFGLEHIDAIAKSTKQTKAEVYLDLLNKIDVSKLSEKAKEKFDKLVEKYKD